MAENKVIAIDLGGTNLRIALVKGKKIYNYTKVSTPKNKKDLLNILIKLISKFNDKNVKGIGIASPGPLKDGVILNTPNLPIKNFNLKKFLEKKFNKKVFIENDANCVALSESRYGCKKKNFFILTLGTGIGGGIIINGKIFNGNGNAGELGHIILDRDKSFEDLWKEHRLKSKKQFGKTLHVHELLNMKDKKAKNIIEETTKYLGQGIASLISVFDPEIVILMGGIRECGDKLLNKIKKQVYNHTIITEKTPVQWSKLAHPGILGASLLVKQVR